MKTLLICLPKDRVGGRRDEENKQRRYGQHIIMGYNRRQSQQGRLDLGCVLAMDSGGERSGLLTRTATMESVSLCMDEKLTAFLRNSNRRFDEIGSVSIITIRERKNENLTAVF